MAKIPARMLKLYNSAMSSDLIYRCTIVSLSILCQVILAYHSIVTGIKNIGFRLLYGNDKRCPIVTKMHLLRIGQNGTEMYSFSTSRMSFLIDAVCSVIKPLFDMIFIQIYRQISPTTALHIRHWKGFSLKHLPRIYSRSKEISDVMYIVTEFRYQGRMKIDLDVPNRSLDVTMERINCTSFAFSHVIRDQNGAPTPDEQFPYFLTLSNGSLWSKKDITDIVDTFNPVFDIATKSGSTLLLRDVLYVFFALCLTNIYKGSSKRNAFQIASMLMLPANEDKNHEDENNNNNNNKLVCEVTHLKNFEDKMVSLDTPTCQVLCQL